VLGVSVGVAGHRSAAFPHQQPGGGDTPGVAVAPVALAAAIIPGVARFIVMLSAHADVFGVGTTVIVGSMLVVASPATGGSIVPGAGLLGTSGVESGKAAPLLGGPPGVALHTVVDELPSGDAGAMVPVVLPTIAVGMVPNGVAGITVDDIIMVDCSGMDGAAMRGGGRGAMAGGCGAGMVEPGSVDMNDVAGCADSASIGGGQLFVVDGVTGTADIVGAAETDGIVPAVALVADMEVICTAGDPGTICPVGVEHVTTVPGVVGSEASGTGASVVSGAPGWVVAENGLGPLRGDVTIVPGVDGRPMAVLPMVETCARPALQLNNKAAAVKHKRRIAIASLRADLACPGLAHRDLAAVGQVDHRVEDDLIARLDAVVHFDFLAEVARNRDLLHMGNAVLDDRDMQAVLIEHNRVGRYDHGWCFARDEQLDGAIDPGTKRAVGIGDVDLGQQRPAPGLQCARYARDLAGKGPIRNLGDTDHRVDTGPKSESLVLRDEHLGADHVGVHQREHEGRSGRHQAAVVDVALCDHAVKWRHHALVGLLLPENSNLGLLGGNI
jgi:hypothetical protein